MPDTWSLTRFLFCSFTGRLSSSWRHTANPEDAVLMTFEVIDLMLELILHTTRETVRLQVCRLYGQLLNWSRSTSWLSRMSQTSQRTWTIESLTSTAKIVTFHRQEWRSWSIRRTRDLHDSELWRLRGRWEQDWCRNVNPGHLIDAWPLTRFFWCLYGQRTSSWGHTANLEDTMSASAEVNDLMMELMLHRTRGTVRLTSSSPSRTSTELIRIYLWISRVSRTSQWTRETKLKYAKDQGFCTTLRYVVFTDGKNKICDAMRIQNTALDASRLFVDPVFSERLLLALCCCFPRASNANGDALRIQSTTCWRQPKLLTYCRS